MSQDAFVLEFFKNSGYFLDFGCGDGRSQPCANNTLLLEENGWDGISIDFDKNYIDNFNHTRKTKAYCIDLTQVNLRETLIDLKCPKIIDYFSFDIDAATENVLQRFPFNDFKFKLITFEHDLYAGKNNLKNMSMELFKNNNYQVLFENVCLDGCGAVEDWYINKDFFDYDCIARNINHKDILQTYKIKYD